MALEHQMALRKVGQRWNTLERLMDLVPAQKVVILPGSSQCIPPHNAVLQIIAEG